MTLSIAVVCEARADFLTITTLAERLIMDSADWIHESNIRDFVRWRGYRASEEYLAWTDTEKLREELKILVRFRRGLPRNPYAQNALRAIRVLAKSPDPWHAIVLVVDSDNELARWDGLRQGRDHDQPITFPIVVGLPHTKRECWHLAGFEPQTDLEKRVLEDLRQELGFDPRIKSHELTAKHDPNNDRRSAKRVLSHLTNDDPDREAGCLRRPFTELEARGSENGLRDFLQELRVRLIPLFDGTPPEAKPS